MARSWLRDTTTNRLTGRVVDDVLLEVAVPGHDWIPDAEIRAAYATGAIGAGGDWNKVAYVPAAGASGTELVTERRRYLMHRLELWVQAPALSFTAQQDAPRGPAYAAVCEAHSRAILATDSSDQNMTDDARHTIIKTELDKDPARFLWRFSFDAWYANRASGYYRTALTTWVYYTSGDLDSATTPDTVTGTAQSTIHMAATAPNILSEIAKFS